MILNVRVENLPEGIEPFYVWRFGDEETVRTEKPRLVHQFPASGRYEVRVGVYYDRTSDHPATIILGETTKRIEVGQPR